MAEFNAEQAYNDGTLRALTKGLVQRYIREGHALDILPDIAVPIVRLSESLRKMGLTAEANSILEHAVHDGVQPQVLAQAMAIFTKQLIAPSPPDETLTIGPLAQIRVGPPPAGTDAASTQELANWLRDRALSKDT